jgi:hypothetical protein
MVAGKIVNPVTLPAGRAMLATNPLPTGSATDTNTIGYCRNSNTGGIEVYDISNNQITNVSFIGTVDLDWQFSGVGNFSGVPDETHLLLRNSKTGGPLNPIWR